MLHDPHKNPEPVLVLSGLSYLIPCYMAFKRNRYYDGSSYLFLTLTTVGFHGTRYDSIFFLDCIAILNFIISSHYNSLKSNNFTRGLYYSSISYSLISYFVGQQFQIMSFDPDWNTQMIYHSLIHLSSSYLSYLYMNQISCVE